MHSVTELDISWATTIISSVLGLIAGLVGSLIAPWVHWGIEKRKMKILRRQELVSSWRSLLHDVSYAKITASEVTKYKSLKNLVEGHEHFPSLQPFLTAETQKLLANTAGSFWDSDEAQPAYDAIFKDVNAMEQKWDLI